MKYVFYKGCLISDLKPDYIPGTVTKDFKEALKWKERIESSKSKGVARNVRHGKAIIIEINFDGEILSHGEFQKAGVSEHSRNNCWTSQHKTKAQINEVVNYRVLTNEEINNLFKL